ncbi:MAG: hypothetical protein R2709_07315 [Marmoricola sp.]
MSSGVRAGVLAILLIALVSVQYAALDLIAVHGVVPNLVLLLTVAAGLSMDLPVAVVLAFVAAYSWIWRRLQCTLSEAGRWPW